MRYLLINESVKPMNCKSFFGLILLLTAAVHPLCSVAQDKLELGLFLGASYYMGELNASQQFRMTRPAAGVVGRYVFTDRIAVKANVTAVSIAGKYPWSGDVYLHSDASDNEYKFDRTFIDAAVMGEVNFLSYDHMFRKKQTRFTPYITVGVGAACYEQYTDKNDGETVFVLSLPFGFGVKYKANKWLRLGLEWTLHKTFADDLDYMGETNSIDPSDPYGFNTTSATHNNDWYSCIGAIITLNMWPRALKCNDGVRNFEQ